MKKIIFTILILGIIFANTPGLLKQNKTREANLMVLCYHHLDLTKPTPYSLHTIDFLKQITALEKEGYVFISLKEVANFYHKGTAIPEKSAVITFDDGNRSVYTTAYPLLQAKHIPLAVFIYPSIINYGHRKGAMSWAEIKELKDNGVSIGCHTYYHPRLDQPPLNIFTTANYNAWLDYQIKDSKKLIEMKIGAPVKYFATPYGIGNKVVYSKIQEAKYELAFNTDDANNDKNTDPLNLNRIVVLKNMTPAQIVEKSRLKPLLLEDTYPEDLSVVTGNRFWLKFRLSEPARFEPGSLLIKLPRVGTLNAEYNHAENYFQKEVKLPATGVYLVEISAQDRQKQKYAASWLFSFKKHQRFF